MALDQISQLLNINYIGNEEADRKNIESSIVGLFNRVTALESAQADNLAEIAGLKAALERGEQCVGALRELAHRHGWNGVENSKILHVFLADLIAALEARAVAAETELERYSKEDQQVHENYMGQLERHLGRKPESLPDGIDDLARDRDALAALAEERRVALEKIRKSTAEDRSKFYESEDVPDSVEYAWLVATEALRAKSPTETPSPERNSLVSWLNGEADEKDNIAKGFSGEAGDLPLKHIMQVEAANLRLAAELLAIPSSALAGLERRVRVQCLRSTREHLESVMSAMIEAEENRGI